MAKEYNPFTAPLFSASKGSPNLFGGNNYGNSTPAPKRRLSTSEFKLVYKSYKGKCGYCNKRVPFEDAAQAHDKANARGGKATITNIMPAHASCNTDARTNSFREIEKKKQKILNAKARREGKFLPRKATKTRKKANPRKSRNNSVFGPIYDAPVIRLPPLF